MVPCTLILSVGTFGLSSASCYWSRVSGAIGRLAQYLSGHTSATWHMLVADDFHLEAGGQDYRFALISFFVLLAVAGVPLSWPKTAGGDTVIWVVFEMIHIARKLEFRNAAQTGSRSGHQRLQLPGQYCSRPNQFERFRGVLEFISRFEFDFRRRGFFFQQFDHTQCGRTCACAVACLFPHNSISNVVASVTIHDDKDI